MDAPHGTRAIKVQNLSLPSFSAFGSYANMFHAERPHGGASQTEFFRDVQQLGLSPAGMASVSLCLAQPRQMVLDVLECSRGCAWGIVPVDGDVYLQLAPASAGDTVPCDALTVFLIPRGTLCTLNPGVWHYAPYPVGSAAVHALIIQPAALPAERSSKRELEPWQQVHTDI